jgi:hypothetical protein
MDTLDSLDGMIVTRETLISSNPNIAMSMPDGKTSWSAFEASWSPSELRDDLALWSRERAGEFIQSNAAMIASFFETMEDASIKSMVTLAFRLHDLGMESLDYEAEMLGSKFGLESESFKGSLTLLASHTPPDAHAPSGSARSAELSDEQASEPLQKIAPIWADREGCLRLWDQVRESQKDTIGTPSAQDTALLLVHFEYVSLKNATTYTSSLEGLNRQNEDGATEEIHKDAQSMTLRSEARILSAPASRSKM